MDWVGEKKDCQRIIACSEKDKTRVLCLPYSHISDIEAWTITWGIIVQMFLAEINVNVSEIGIEMDQVSEKHDKLPHQLFPQARFVDVSSEIKFLCETKEEDEIKNGFVRKMIL